MFSLNLVEREIQLVTVLTRCCVSITCARGNFCDGLGYTKTPEPTQAVRVCLCGFGAARDYQCDTTGSDCAALVCCDEVGCSTISIAENEREVNMFQASKFIHTGFQHSILLP